jgi:hypothetical protein
MPTTGGALAFAGLVPPYEATLVTNLREAGAVIIAKTVLTELANWVASADNPLTARVYVNRVWSKLLGVGIVSTVDNFGAQGEAPTHPELLDYLTLKFVADGWSTKQIIREIVLSRVYAIGEVACTGLHGANRLASTSLLECLTSAKFTAQADAVDLARATFPPSEPRAWESPSRAADPVLVRQDIDQIRTTMWNYAGIVRSPKRLTRARRILLELREEIQDFYRGCALTRELIELRNAIQTALLVVHAATLNPRSQGCHYVEPDTD